MQNEIMGLDEALINQIAAGEVVERPASALKELVENSLDAGADRIEVFLEEGGRRLIKVVDNGRGILQEDLERALTRHMTSKIASLEDLFSIRSMGFRGEALASICSVSRFTIQSRSHLQPEGMRIQMSDQNIIKDSWSGAVGSHVEVADLFYNVPARQAFLKTPATEYAQCFEYLQALALVRPDVEFVLQHNGREVLRAPRVVDGKPKSRAFWGEDVLKSRFAAVFPKESAKELLYVKLQDTYADFEALCSAPGGEKANSRFMLSFVNDRWVKDKLLRFAIQRGYHSHLLKGKYPVCLLYLHLDPSLVDVNVHPSKTELRFQYASELQSIIAHGIRDRLRKADWSGSSDIDLEIPSSDVSRNHTRAGGLASRHSPAGASSQSSKTTYTQKEDSWNPDFDLSFSRNKQTVISEPSRRETVMSFDAPLKDQQARNFGATTSSQDLEKTSIAWSELRYIGSFASGYLFFESKNELLVIDQHAFHERILYEKLKRDRSLLLQVQPLLVSEVLNFPPSNRQQLIDSQDSFEQLGFKLSFAGDSEVELHSVPSLLSKKDPEKVLNDLLKLDDSSLSHLEKSSELNHDLLSTIACHSAVRAGDYLDEGEVFSLLSQADGVDFFHNCPHGRRVLKWFKRSQVEAWFDR